VIAVFFVTVALVMNFSHSLLMMLLTMVIFALGLSPFLFPTRYRITNESISMSRLGGTRTRKWEDLRRLDVGTRYALVSPFRTPRFLDRQRGLFVLFDGTNREEILSLIRVLMKGDQRGSTDVQ